MKSDEPFKVRFGQLVKQYRTKKGWTQVQLARAVYANEENSTRVSDIETGRYDPQATTISDYQLALNIPSHKIDALRAASDPEAQLNAGLFGKHPYDWISEFGSEGRSKLRVGLRILYEEHSLFPEMDREQYQLNQSLIVPENPYYESPRGFLKLHPRDPEWLDPRDRSRRILDGVIENILEDGRILFDKKYGTPCPLNSIVDIVD